MLRGNRVPALLMALLTAVTIRLAAEAAPTPDETEGPFYKTGSPEREALFGPSDPGRRIVLTGKVLDSKGSPVSHAWLDFWQADARGRYDNAGFSYRGHVFTDASGVYRVRTVVPGEYPGRTPHIHVKLRAGNGPVLTTQLFFPDDGRTCDDPLFKEETVVDLTDVKGGQEANFDFVVDTRQS